MSMWSEGNKRLMDKGLRSPWRMRTLSVGRNRNIRRNEKIVYRDVELPDGTTEKRKVIVPKQTSKYTPLGSRMGPPKMQKKAA